MRPPTLFGALTNAALVVGQINLPVFGLANPFGCLSLSGITNTGLTNITGDTGAAINPLLTSSITGFPPGICTGSSALAAIATLALTDATTAYTTIAALANASVLTGELGGLTLLPGVYKFLSSAQITTTLILLGAGSSTDAWYFQIGSTLVTSSGSKVVFSGTASPNVFWQVGSSATFGTGCSMVGKVLAAISITVNHGATCDGGLYSLAGSITLDTNVVSAQVVVAPGTPTSSQLPVTSTAAPRSSLRSTTSAPVSPPLSVSLSVPPVSVSTTSLPLITPSTIITLPSMSLPISLPSTSFTLPSVPASSSTKSILVPSTSIKPPSVSELVSAFSTRVVSPQSSPHFTGVPSRSARDTSPLYSPSLHFNLTHPHWHLLCTLHRLTSTHPSCLGVLIPGHAAVESVNS
ncbi:uncharacterized protein PAC_19683 [Phialocephala subalpina]|uniref:DUF3494 domain-containing protein n=1 Tax=Phialocephala subalpina TaxID=576137 RepID=A0A1L7XXJ7_9HELO|nr:uncharacterized protein PAC_19683 [Phialocephala subalpina]